MQLSASWQHRHIYIRPKQISKYKWCLVPLWHCGTILYLVRLVIFYILNPNPSFNLIHWFSSEYGSGKHCYVTKKWAITNSVWQMWSQWGGDGLRINKTQMRERFICVQKQLSGHTHSFQDWEFIFMLKPSFGLWRHFCF